MGRQSWIPLLLLLACESGERLEGLERVTATLEAGVVATREEAEALRSELATAKVRADEADEDRKALEERVQTLEGALQRLEAKLDAPPQVPAVEEPAVVEGRPDPRERYQVPVDGSASRGPADAKVTLVMITDFQCPFCKRVQPTLRALEKRYGDDLRVVVKHNPLPMHPRARAAALAAEAAHEQGKFWELHDLLYENSRALSDEDLQTWAKNAGCSVSRFRSDVTRAALGRRVDDDVELARTLGARGTPLVLRQRAVYGGGAAAAGVREGHRRGAGRGGPSHRGRDPAGPALRDADARSEGRN